MNDDDLLILTADHGIDPTFPGSDHTREQIPVIIYSKSIKDGREIPEHNSFADLGRTIIENFNLKPVEPQIGELIEEVLL